jgi:hypothetical protein
VNGPKTRTEHSHPPQDFAIRTTRLRHRFTTFWWVGKAIHNFGRIWQVRFTTWTPRFTTWFTTFGREKARMARSEQRSPFSRYVPLLPLLPYQAHYHYHHSTDVRHRCTLHVVSANMHVTTARPWEIQARTKISQYRPFTKQMMYVHSKLRLDATF